MCPELPLCCQRSPSFDVLRLSDSQLRCHRHQHLPAMTCENRKGICVWRPFGFNQICADVLALYLPVYLLLSMYVFVFCVGPMLAWAAELAPVIHLFSKPFLLVL